jgi:hypothetical protein
MRPAEVLEVPRQGDGEVTAIPTTYRTSGHDHDACKADLLATVLSVAVLAGIAWTWFGGLDRGHRVVVATVTLAGGVWILQLRRHVRSHRRPTRVDLTHPS